MNSKLWSIRNGIPRAEVLAKVPEPGRRWMSPSASSRTSASRTIERLAPNRSTSSVSVGKDDPVVAVSNHTDRSWRSRETRRRPCGPALAALSALLTLRG